MLLQLLGLLLLLLLLMIVFCLTVAPDDDITDEPSKEPCDEPYGSSLTRQKSSPIFNGGVHLFSILQWQEFMNAAGCEYCDWIM